MRTRQHQEELELSFLEPQATKARTSLGRRFPEAEDSLRTCFQRDRDRILHSKSFRRLKHKTQVFISPEGDHYRTRLTHTLEVAQIGRTIARALGLNEDLVEAIALGHDLGHTPFGHTGEHVLNRLHPGGFRHYEQSLRVVDFLEKHGQCRGLNLTEEVRDGILNHTGSRKAKTPEGQIIKFADRIAYINHDIDDAVRAGILCASSIPKELLNNLGYTHGERIDRMIRAMMFHPEEGVFMEDSTYEMTMELRRFMFQNVYANSQAKSEDEKVARVIEDLFCYYASDERRLPEEHRLLYKGRQESREDRICDYIAGMTDRFALERWKEITVPKHWQG